MLCATDDSAYKVIAKYYFHKIILIRFYCRYVSVIESFLIQHDFADQIFAATRIDKLSPQNKNQ